MVIYNQLLLEDRRYCVYKITNLINGKGYVGQTKQFDKRIKNHKKNSSKCIAIRDAIQKYGWDNFTSEIIEDNLSFEKVQTQESYYIKFYNTLAPNGYNLTTGGGGCIISEESLLKRSGENHWTFELKTEDHPNYGRTHTNEAKLKQSERITGKLNPMYGRCGELNPMFGLKGELNPNFGKKHTEETLLKRSKKLRKQFLITFPDGHTEITNNLKQFCIDNNLCYSGMVNVSNLQTKQHKGFKCEHYNEI